MRSYAIVLKATNADSQGGTDTGVTQSFTLKFEDDWAGKEAGNPGQVSFNIDKSKTVSIGSWFTANSDTIVTKIDGQDLPSDSWL